jgi:hypothetical protein
MQINSLLEIICFIIVLFHQFDWQPAARSRRPEAKTLRAENVKKFWEG